VTDAAPTRRAGGDATTGPTVSIITPCLNPGARLERCLRSVAAQSYPGVEHVIVDGGSSDGTLALLEAFPALRFVSEPDSGQASAINKGTALAHGSILSWLNADDQLLPDAVERTVAVFASAPAVGLVYGDCRIIENGRELMTWRPPRRFSLAALEGGSSIPQPGTFVRRGALEQVGGLDESFELAMDVDLWLRLLAAGVECRRLRGTVSIFELHPDSKTGLLPRERFFEENVRAFLLAGRLNGAALSLGQRAAWAALVDGRVPGERLARELEAAQQVGAQATPPLPARTIAAAAHAEAAVIELHRSPRGLRHLSRIEIWREPRAIRRLAGAIRRGAPRVLRTLLRRSAPRAY
jgi:GT2 family glycosyltransferase